MQFRTAVLPNGLEIVAECNAQAYSTALGFFVRSGARDETDEVSGVSHFLEHMAFKGTATRSADDVNREFDELGAHYNAFTNEENTVFYAAVLPEFQGRALALLADILRPALRKRDFQTEKKVILEEIEMYSDQPPFGADEKCRAMYFGPHPLGRSVLGTQKSIKALGVEAMRAYFRRCYSPGNIVVGAAGRVDFEALLADARQACGQWAPAPGGRSPEPATPHPAFRAIARPTATQQYVLQLAQGPAARDPDRYAAKLLATVLGDDSGSRLYWELVDPGLAEHAEVSHCEYEGAGVFMTYLSCAPAEAADNLRRLLGVFRTAQSDGITAAELEQAKSKVRSRLVLSAERPRGRLFSVGSDWLYRREYRPLEADMAELAALAVDDLAHCLARYPLTCSTTLVIGPSADCPDPA
ncbi:MAG: pitrilysin family protein [Thermoguttaceae bacterium]|jgi:predicted Zn-dependent peptidase